MTPTVETAQYMLVQIDIGGDRINGLAAMRFGL